jgi:hypothetical protein
MDWRIDRIRERCLQCSVAFAHDQRVVSVIEADAVKIARRDLCEKCAPKQAPPDVIWWETRFQAHAPKRKRVVPPPPPPPPPTTTTREPGDDHGGRSRGGSGGSGSGHGGRDD